MSIWHSTEAVCLVLGLICIFYYIGIVGYAGITADFAWIWLMGAAFLLAIAGGMAAESRHHMAVLANLLRAAGILMAIGILVVGFIGAHFPQKNPHAGARKMCISMWIVWITTFQADFLQFLQRLRRP